MDYRKIWALFRSETDSERQMARIANMSPSGFRSMMERETMTVETLETIASHFKKPLNYFFDNLEYTHDSGNNVVPDLPLALKVGPQNSENAPNIEMYTCPDCVIKQKEITFLKKELELKDELLSLYRDKKESSSATGS